MEGKIFFILIALVASGFAMSMSVSGGEQSPASQSTLGTFELVTDLKSEANFSKTMTFLKFKPEDLDRIYAVKNLKFKLELMDAELSDYKHFKYTVLGLNKEIVKEFENGLLFSDNSFDGRKRSAMIRISGRVVTILQYFEESDLSAQIIGLFYPEGCEVTLTATNTKGTQDDFHMSRFYFKRV